jgi:acetyltransferase-like isoleucine patch superfamily enzyme
LTAEEMRPEGTTATARVGDRLGADPGVLIAYAGSRDVAADFSLGCDATLRSGTVLYGGSHIGARFQTGHHVVVREECLIGDDVSVWSNTVVDYGCRIGHRVKIHSNCYLAQYTEILDNAFLAPGVTVANDLYPGKEESARRMSGPLVGAGAQIGVNVTLLPFVRIGDGCLVGAGSVVTHDLPPEVVAFGNPARVQGRVADLVDIDQRLVPEEASISGYRMHGRHEAEA